MLAIIAIFLRVARRCKPSKIGATTLISFCFGIKTLGALIEQIDDEVSEAEIGRETGLLSGTLYPIFEPVGRLWMGREPMGS